MNVVCMIRDYPALRYFVNRMHDEFGVQAVFVERPPVKGRVRQKLKDTGWRELAGSVASFLSRKLKRRKTHAALDRVLGERWRALNPDVHAFETESINGGNVAEELERLQPDVIAVHGTGIVKRRILNKAPLALNLHWGLSPYYRGTHCTNWALVNWDPYNIGVTIHKLTKVIDGGSILAQARPEIDPGDSLNDINMKLTVLGTGLMVEALSRHARGEELTYHKQRLSLGYLTLNRQYTWRVRALVRSLEREGKLAQMLEKPARSAKLPIVTFDGLREDE